MPTLYFTVHLIAAPAIHVLELSRTDNNPLVKTEQHVLLVDQYGPVTLHAARNTD